MKQFIRIITLCCCLSACKDKPNEAPKPVLPEGDFQVEATLSEGNKLTVAWSSPKDLEGGAALTYTVYLGDKELGKTKENAISANISGNRFVNGRVITTDAAGRTRMKVFLITGDGRDLVYIPDSVFEGYLIANLLDHDGQTNSQMSLEDAMRIEKVEYGSYNDEKPDIDNLIGVEAFSDLEILYCSYNKGLSNLDLSKNINLKELDCRDNQLKSLNLSKNINLKELDCRDNQLTSLNLSKHINLEGLSCWGNQLTSLELSKNINLEHLSCWDNQLTSLDLSKNINLKRLNCDNNQLTSLDLSKNINLEGLICSDNQLTILDVSMLINLVGLFCSNNQLTSLGLSKNAALRNLSCQGNPNLITICVADVEKAQAQVWWRKPETAAYVKCD